MNRYLEARNTAKKINELRIELIDILEKLNKDSLINEINELLDNEFKAAVVTVHVAKLISPKGNVVPIQKTN